MTNGVYQRRKITGKQDSAVKSKKPGVDGVSSMNRIAAKNTIVKHVPVLNTHNSPGPAQLLEVAA